jgi:hypothetical protein
MTSPVTLGAAGLYRVGTVRTKLRRFGPPLSAGGPLPAIGHGLEIGGDIQATTKVVDCRSLKSSPPCVLETGILETCVLETGILESGVLETPAVLN